MIYILFSTIVALHAFCSLYFINRFRLPTGHKLTSLALSVNTLGWGFAVAIELHWVPRWLLNLTIPLAFVSVLVLVLAILLVETQNPRGPFR